MSNLTLLLGDCLDVGYSITPLSVRAVITDIPYGTTKCQWDTVIPFDLMWKLLDYVLVPDGVFITTTSQPFTSSLIMSNPSRFVCEWIWKKNRGSNFSSVKRLPMKEHESVVVFSRGRDYIYHPIMQERAESTKNWAGKIKSHGTKSEHHTMKRIRKEISALRYPSSVQTFLTESRPVHPTQKPVELYEYIIRSYTNEGDTVLDIAVGSGTTLVACRNTHRTGIGIEKDSSIYQKALSRLST